MLVQLDLRTAAAAQGGGRDTRTLPRDKKRTWLDRRCCWVLAQGSAWRLAAQGPAVRLGPDGEYGFTVRELVLTSSDIILGNEAKCGQAVHEAYDSTGKQPLTAAL